MADEEQVKRLLAGVEGWNKWREVNPGIEIDLKGANLRRTVLRRANLKNADLSGANIEISILGMANLRGAHLENATLRGTDLREADLRGADLSLALLDGTLLSGADLTKANLFGAILIESILINTEFMNAYMNWTVLGDVDLSEARSLENVNHLGSSTLAINTIKQSKGKIPEKFLRGCGLSDQEILFAKLYQPGLDPNQITDITYKIAEIMIGNPIQYHSCFISYSNKDEEFAKKLYEDLQNKGVRCWFAPEDMKTGDPIRRTIGEQVRMREKLLVILSKNSIKSAWVGDEVEKAFEEEKRTKTLKLFPIRVDEAVMKAKDDWAEAIRLSRHIGDFSENYEKAFERLLKDLQARE